MSIHKNHIFKGALMLMAAGTLASCSDSFLEERPLSFYEPGTTYTTEAGLQSALAQCDKQLTQLAHYRRQSFNLCYRIPLF